MSEQNNTTNQSILQNKLVRVIRIEFVTSRLNVLQFIPSAFLPEVAALLEQADEVELRFKIDGSIKEIQRIRAAR